MLILVTYDVETMTPEGQKRLRRVAKACLNYGQRVQNSVFECNVDITQYTQLKMVLSGIIDDETDSIRLYNLGNTFASKVETLGKNNAIDLNGTLMI